MKQPFGRESTESLGDLRSSYCFLSFLPSWSEAIKGATMELPLLGSFHHVLELVPGKHMEQLAMSDFVYAVVLNKKYNWCYWSKYGGVGVFRDDGQCQAIWKEFEVIHFGGILPSLKGIMWGWLVTPRVYHLNFHRCDASDESSRPSGY